MLNHRLIIFEIIWKLWRFQAISCLPYFFYFSLFLLIFNDVCQIDRYDLYLFIHWHWIKTLHVECVWALIVEITFVDQYCICAFILWILFKFRIRQNYQILIKSIDFVINYYLRMYRVVLNMNRNMLLLISDAISRICHWEFFFHKLLFFIMMNQDSIRVFFIFQRINIFRDIWVSVRKFNFLWIFWLSWSFKKVWRLNQFCKFIFFSDCVSHTVTTISWTFVTFPSWDESVDSLFAASHLRFLQLSLHLVSWE